jgi:Tol biopolymer transport system component
MALSRLVLLILMVTVLNAGCQEDTHAPEPGGLQITVVTTGVDLDPNGYSAAVDSAGGTAVPVNGSATVPNLGSGEHRVTLSGLDDNCALQEPSPIAVSVPENGQATVTLHIICTYANTLAYVQDDDVYLTAATPGATPRLIAEGYTTVTWSPDGSTLALLPSAPPNGIFLADAAGGNPRQLTRTYADQERLAEPVWSPDGLVLLFKYRSAFPLSGLSQQLRRVNRDGSGEGFFFPQDQGSDAEISAAWSPDGAHLAVDHTGQICLYTPAAVLERCLTRGQYPSWSPDGARLAFAVSTADDGNYPEYHIHTIAVDGNDDRDLTPRLAPRSSEFLPAWSPDGTQLLFRFAEYLSGENTTARRAWVMDADGRNRVDLAPGLVVELFAWSRDGSKIALVVGSTVSVQQLYVVNRDGTELTPLDAAGAISSIAWRP